MKSTRSPFCDREKGEDGGIAYSRILIQFESYMKNMKKMELPGFKD